MCITVTVGMCFGFIVVTAHALSRLASAIIITSSLVIVITV